jgi:soluble lytic murein transglycosylase
MILKGFRNITAALCSTAACAAAADENPKPDAAYLAAYDAFRSGNAIRLAKHASALRGHVLEPYTEYWRLKLQLEDASESDVSDFLGRHSGAYVAELMRAEWLKVLGKRRNWPLFEREIARLETEDPEVGCYELSARIARGDDAALDAAAAVWLDPAPLLEGCSRLVDELRNAGRLAAPAVWTRVRVLFAHGQTAEAKRTLGYLPRGQAPNERDLDHAARRPQQILSRKPLRLEQQPAREVAVLATARLARDDARAAARALQGALGPALANADREYLWGRIGQEAARQHDPRALDWFALAGDAVLEDGQLAWKARAALRQGNWPVVREAIEAMSQPARQDPAWIYWHARALAAEGQVLRAQARFLTIAAGTGFYNLLAAEELGETPRLPEPMHEPPEKDVDAARSHPGLARALELHRLGLGEDAMREWIHSVRNMDDEQLIAAAELAHRAGAFARAINTAGRTTHVHNFRLRYLAPYRDIFEQHARAHDVDEAWLFAVARQESRFATDARSGVGARGLMQVMPTTAKWVARRSGMRGYRPDRVHDVETNVSLGTRYFKNVLDRFGHPVLALTAYNAGPTRARRWREETALEGAVYAETIPFFETRDYVKKVMASAIYYSALLHGNIVPLKERLGVVPGRGTGD